MTMVYGPDPNLCERGSPLLRGRWSGVAVPDRGVVLRRLLCEAGLGRALSS